MFMLPSLRDWVPSVFLPARCRIAIRPSRTRTGYEGSRTLGSSRHWPVRRSKLCLKMGEAILGTPPRSPTMPRAMHERLAERIEVADGVDLRVALRPTRTTAICRPPTSARDAGVGRDVVQRADVDPAGGRRRGPIAAASAEAAVPYQPSPVSTQRQRRHADRLLAPGGRPVLVALGDEHDAGIGRVGCSRTGGTAAASPDRSSVAFHSHS